MVLYNRRRCWGSDLALDVWGRRKAFRCPVGAWPLGTEEVAVASSSNPLSNSGALQRGYRTDEILRRRIAFQCRTDRRPCRSMRATGGLQRPPSSAAVAPL